MRCGEKGFKGVGVCHEEGVGKISLERKLEELFSTVFWTFGRVFWKQQREKFSTKILNLLEVIFEGLEES